MRRSLYSRMFSDEKRTKLGGYGYQKLKEVIQKESQIKSYKPRKHRYINLNVKYRKPLVARCNNCGMTVAGFVKKCPRCGEAVS
jgi:rubrerythrin